MNDIITVTKPACFAERVKVTAFASGKVIAVRQQQDYDDYRWHDIQPLDIAAASVSIGKENATGEVEKT